MSMFIAYNGKIFKFSPLLITGRMLHRQNISKGYRSNLKENNSISK